LKIRVSVVRIRPQAPPPLLTFKRDAPTAIAQSMKEIVTPRLQLRPARPEDADALHAVFSDARAMRYWSTPPHESLGQTRAWLAEMIAASPEESCDFIVERDGVAIGKAGCWRAPEIGFILGPAHWGQGLAREALSAAIPVIFERLPVPALTADVDPRNAASLALLARLGFRETGRAARTWQVGGAWCDSVYLVLPRERGGSSGGAP
jgi:[ribosomal protein S5]-alanine N-acetyltransferase